MKKVKNKSINIKRKVYFRRIEITIARITIIMLFVFTMMMILFVIISETVAWLKIGRFFNFFQEWEIIIENGKDFKGGLNQDISAIFVAAASILVAVSTLVQAHFTRVQDRVSNFPKNYFSWMSVGIKLEEYLKHIRKYFYRVMGNSYIEFNIKEGFSTCYKANPYRMYIFVIDYNDERETVGEEIKIYQSKCINLYDSNVNSYDMLIDCDQKSLLSYYFELPPENENCTLKIIMDIEWINQLIPKLWRWFSNIYIREEIFLMRSSKINKSKNKRGNHSLFENKFNILYTEHYRAPFSPHIKIIKNTN